MSDIPEVGMGATEHGTFRKLPYVVVDVSKSKAKVVLARVRSMPLPAGPRPKPGFSTVLVDHIYTAEELRDLVEHERRFRARRRHDGYYMGPFRVTFDQARLLVYAHFPYTD